VRPASRVAWLGLAALAACDAVDVGAQADAGPACDPAIAGGVLWVEEGSTAEAEIECATGADPGGAGFVLDELPAGTTYDPARRVLTVAPGLDGAAMVAIPVVVPAVAELGTIRVGVVDRFDDPDNVPVLDPSAYPEEYGLPVVFVSPTPIDSEIYQPVTVVYRGRTFAIAGKLRGKSSLSYPKRSYTLDFSGDHLDDPEHGLVDREKIVLTTTFDDNSQLRTRLTWDLWNRLAPTLPVAATTVVLFLDGEYHGLYTLSDHIDDELAVRAGLPEDGNVYKAIDHDANFSLIGAGGEPKATPHDGYEKKHGLPEPGSAGAFADLDALVELVASADDPTFGAEIAGRVHVPDFEAWWLLATFIRADDSAGKNSYLFHGTGTLWHVVPWDFNASFGQSWYTTRVGHEPVDPYDSANRLFARLRSHPDHAPTLAARRSAELGTGGALELAWIEARIDELALELAPGAERDDRRWREQYLTFERWSSRTDFTTWAQEVAYVRAWIELRAAAVADLE
jgi:hypothetical protein